MGDGRPALLSAMDATKQVSFVEASTLFYKRPGTSLSVLTLWD
jgi:hypothetical protein